MLVLAVYVLFMLTTGLLNIDWALTADAGVERFIGTIVLPLTAAVLYLLAVFSFGLSGDLAARESMYLPRLFTLPLTTAALVGWPMLFGAMVMLILAQAARLASWPSEAEPPFWLLLFAPVLLAWTQVLTWASYPVRGLRVVAAVALLISIDMIAIVGIELKPREPVMAAVLAPLLPLAWLAAYAAVRQARRGDVPDWRGTFAPIRSLARVWPRREQFASPLSAQTWCEWRQHGWSLPVLVALVLPFALGLPFLDPESSSFVIISLAVTGLTPPIMASFVASTVRRAGAPHGGESGLPPFLATRPLTSAALIAAKLRVSILSTLITWLIVIAAVPLALTLSNTWPLVIERAQELRDFIGLPRALAVAILAVLALVAITWKRLVTSLYIGLSGRPWMARVHIGATLLLLVAAIPFVQWIGSNTASIVVRILDAVPVAAAVLVALKMSAAAWIMIRLDRSRLIEPRALLVTAAAGLAAVLALYAVFAWMAETPVIPRYALLLLAILAIPLTRLSAAPLALASNRHR